jgi:DGQHR domain-containing protein
MSSSELSEQYYFNIPCAAGFQGNTKILIMNVPARALTTLLAADNEGHTLKRSQREVNDRRVTKIVNYLTDAVKNDRPFIIPPLVGNCNCHFEIDFIGDTQIGIARIPMDAVIQLFDGQHRQYGIKEFIIKNPINLTIPVMLTENLDLKTRQQFFSDINNNASKPSASINMVYDGRDDIAQVMVKVTQGNEILRDLTDYEHNVVPAKSECFVSFKALCDATTKFIGSGDTRMSEENVCAVWCAWLQLTALGDIKGTVKQYEYRKEYLQFNAVMVVAYGFAVARLMTNHSINEVISMIERLAISSDTWAKEKFFMIAGWGGICAITDKERPTVIASVSAQKAAAEKLVELFEKGHF